MPGAAGRQVIRENRQMEDDYPDFTLYGHWGIVSTPDAVYVTKSDKDTAPKPEAKPKPAPDYSSAFDEAMKISRGE